MDLDRLLRVDVDEHHRPSRVVGPDGNGRQVEGAELEPDLLEHVTVGRVAPEPEPVTLE